MITSIAKLIASNLRIVADTLDPKPVVSNDYTIHIKDAVLDPLYEETLKDTLKWVQAMSPGRF